MVSDVKLDGDSVIIETDNNPKGNKLILDDAHLKGQVFDFDLDHPDRRNPNAPANPRRRALVHGPGDKLVLNWNGDYPGGVEIVGKVNIQNPIVGKIANLTIIDNLKVENASNDGINVDKAMHSGLDVLQSDGFGVLVENAANGITVQDAAENGFNVIKAGNKGLYIQKSGGIGILVDEATDGVLIQNVSGNGFQVDNAGNSGIYIKKSGGAGVLIDQAASGVSVQNVVGNGFQVDNAGGYGLIIENSANEFFVAGPLANRKFQIKQSGRVDSIQGCSVPPCSAELVETEEGSLAGYEPGDVLVISDSKDRTVTKSTKNYSTKIAGIYCEKPGIIGSKNPLEDPKNNEIALAVSGIVPCKVSASPWPIKRGDLLCTSNIPGCAMRAPAGAPQVGSILGKAFGELPSGQGKIDVLIMLR